MVESKVKDLDYEKIWREEKRILNEVSDSEFEYRMLNRDDYKRGYMDILAMLTVVGVVT